MHACMPRMSENPRSGCVALHKSNNNNFREQFLELIWLNLHLMSNVKHVFLSQEAELGQTLLNFSVTFYHIVFLN